MSDRDTIPGATSYEDVLRHLQDALTAVGALEKAIGDLGSEEVLNMSRSHLSTAVNELQQVRQRLTESIGRD